MMQLCTCQSLSFNKTTMGEFTKTIYADIPGVHPENVYFEKLNNSPYDNEVRLNITCYATEDNEFKSYFGVLPINLKEFYGFDYFVECGILRIVLYKEKKENIQLLGFGHFFNSKYPKKEQIYI